jgi:hypothetical protein
VEIFSKNVPGAPKTLDPPVLFSQGTFFHQNFHHSTFLKMRIREFTTNHTNQHERNPISYKEFISFMRFVVELRIPAAYPAPFAFIPDSCYTPFKSEPMKLPIGIQTFSDIRKNGYLYVDKTRVNTFNIAPAPLKVVLY